MNFACSAFARLAAIAILAGFAVALPQTVVAQGDPLAGTWNFVPERSKSTSGPAPYQSLTLTFSDSGESQMTLEGVDAEGKPVKGTVPAVADGKSRPVTGMADFDAASLNRFSDTITSYSYTKRRAVVVLGSRVLSPDGNTLTFIEKTFDSRGREISNASLVFAKPGFELASATAGANAGAAAVKLVSPLSAEETAAAEALERGDDDEAIRLFTQVIEASQQTPMLYYDHVSRGIAYAKKNQNELAIADFDAALKLKPDYTDALFRRGGTRLQLKQYDAAIEDLTSVIQADAMNAMAYRLRGFAYNTLGMDMLAAADYDKACALNKDLCQN